MTELTKSCPFRCFHYNIACTNTQGSLINFPLSLSTCALFLHVVCTLWCIVLSCRLCLCINSWEADLQQSLHNYRLPKQLGIYCRATTIELSHGCVTNSQICHPSENVRIRRVGTCCVLHYSPVLCAIAV